MPPPPNRPSVVLDDNFAQFAACFQLEQNTDPLRILDDTAEHGKQRVNAQAILCAALTQVRADVNSRILDFDNYYDCRIENPEARASIINAAVQAAGGKGDGMGFLNSLLAEVDDMREGGNDSAGFITNIIDKIVNGGWPRQSDKVERGFIEGSVNLGLQLTNEILDIVAKAIPGAEKYKGNIRAIIGILIDTLFFIGDYVAEVGAARGELAIRIYALDRTKKMREAYKSAYGVYPSGDTVAKWCKYGAQSGRDPMTAPDGTTGRYDTDKAAWETENRLVTTEWQKMIDTFGPENFGQFIATNVIYAGILNAYTPVDAEEIINGDWSNSITRASRERRNESILATSDPKFVGIGVTCGYPSSEYERWTSFTVPDPDALVCKDFIYMPFWENKAINWGWSQPTYGSGFPTRYADVGNFKRSIMAALSLNYYRVELQVRGKKKVSVPTVTGAWKRGDFADRLLAVRDMWNRWAAGTAPAKGKRGRARLIREKLATLWVKYMGVINSASAATGWSYAYPFPTTGISQEQLWRNVVQFAFSGAAFAAPAPNPQDSKYAGIRARCPDGTKSCMPCDVIKGRRPIGAKPMEIPTLASKSDAERLMSAMRANGYPDYYIDCTVGELLVSPAPGSAPFRTGASARQIATPAVTKTPTPTQTAAVEKAGAAIVGKTGTSGSASAVLNLKRSGLFGMSGLAAGHTTDDSLLAMNDRLRGIVKTKSARDIRNDLGALAAAVVVKPPQVIPHGLRLHGIPDGPPETGVKAIHVILGLAAVGAAAYYWHNRDR